MCENSMSSSEPPAKYQISALIRRDGSIFPLEIFVNLFRFCLFAFFYDSRAQLTCISSRTLSTLCGMLLVWHMDQVQYT